jgi:hypothetical protein
MSTSTKTLYSMRQLSGMLEVEPRVIKGLVLGLCVPTFKSLRRELFIDDDGLARLRSHLEKTEASVA